MNLDAVPKSRVMLSIQCKYFSLPPSLSLAILMGACFLSFLCNVCFRLRKMRASPSDLLEHNRVTSCYGEQGACQQGHLLKVWSVLHCKASLSDQILLFQPFTSSCTVLLLQSPLHRCCCCPSIATNPKDSLPVCLHVCISAHAHFVVGHSWTQTSFHLRLSLFLRLRGKIWYWIDNQWTAATESVYRALEWGRSHRGCAK